MIKILIADDQELIRQSLQIILNNEADFEVTDAVANGLEVVRSVRKNRPDIILMDIRMPEMDGVVCTQIIKENYPDAMINGDIASKVVKLFSKMAQSNLTIQVDELQSDSLKENEWQIIVQVGSGLSNKEIATKLNLSEGTVRNSLSIILSKLGLRDRTQLAIWAVQTGAVYHDLKDKM